MNNHQFFLKLLLRLLVIAFVSTLSVTTISAGEDGKRSFYQWIDDQGGVHITDNLQNVPKKHRSRATSIEQPAAGEGARVIQEQQPAIAPDTGIATDDDELKKAEWQQRMSDAKRQLKEAKRRLGELEKRKLDLMKQWGSAGAALPPQTVLDELAQIEADLVRAKKDVYRENEQVQVTIPDEARRAGIPPGWLREVE